MLFRQVIFFSYLQYSLSPASVVNHGFLRDFCVPFSIPGYQNNQMFFLSEVFAQEQNENEIVAVLRLLLLLLNLLRVCLCTPQTALFEKIHTLLLSVGELAVSKSGRETYFSTRVHLSFSAMKQEFLIPRNTVFS